MTTNGYCAEASRRDGGALAVVWWARLAFRLRALASGEIPPEPGPVLRSAIGAALRAVSCPDGRRDCTGCPSRGTCAYLYLFETPLPDDATRLRAADHVPHPFVLRPWPKGCGRLAGGEVLELEVILVGKAIDLLPHVIVALGRMASAGLGRERVPLALVGVDQVHEPDDRRRPVFDEQRRVGDVVIERLWPVPETEGPLRIDLLSPTHLVSDGRPLREFAFTPFVRALLRRASSLAAFHCGEALDLDFKGLIERAASVRVLDQATEIVGGSRYSRRQGQRIRFEGLVGSARVDGAALTELRDLLALGEVLHVGKGTAFGMGRYAVGWPSPTRRHPGAL